MPLVLGGKWYEHGLSAAGEAEIEYDVKGLYDTFAALVGLDAAAGENSTAEFCVAGDGKELWRSGAIKKSDGPKPVEINITGVQRLVLQVTDAGDGGRCARALADWVELKLRRPAQ